MRVSKNELNAMLKQALEGCGFDAGRYESAADMLVWAEMHGLAVLNNLAGQLARFAGGHTPEIDIKAGEDVALAIDANGASALQCGELIADAVFAKAVARGLCRASVCALRDRQLIAKKLVDCCARGAYCCAFWPDTHQPQTVHSITCLSASACPQIARFETAIVLQHQSLYVVCAMNESGLLDCVADHYAFLHATPSQGMEPAALQSHYQQTLDHGIEIDESLWQTMGALAARVLVETNEQSRKGAGA